MSGSDIVQLADAVERIGARVGRGRGVRALTEYVIGVLIPAFPALPVIAYERELAVFVELEQDKLIDCFARYRDAATPVLFSQPEILIVFERLCVTPSRLESLWQDRLPMDELDFARDVWGA